MADLLRRLRQLPTTIAAASGRTFVRTVEFFVRRIYGLEQFTCEEGCVLRVSLGRATADLMISGDTLVRRGDLVGELHLWNGRIPRMERAGPDLAWGFVSYSRFIRSLGALSSYVDGDPRFYSVKAFRGETAFIHPGANGGMRRVAHAFGFDFVRVPYAATRWGRYWEFCKNLYTWILIWTYNPASLRGKKLLHLRRYQIWISREMLRSRYSAPAGGDSNGARKKHPEEHLTRSESSAAGPEPPP